MKVYDNSSNGIYQPPTSSTRGLQRLDRGLQPAHNYGRPDSSLDRVEVSEVATTLSNVLQLSREERGAEIQRLTKEYEAGRLSFDPRAVAKAILDHESEAS